MKAAEDTRWLVMIPYDPAEGICLKEAATRAGKSPRTVSGWCEHHGIGRRVGGGVWCVSQVALAMFLEDDQIALSSYLAGDRESAAVTAYFRRFGLAYLKSGG